MPNLTHPTEVRRHFFWHFRRFLVKLIICTGFRERISEEMAKGVGIKGLLMKPLIKVELAQETQRVLNASKLTD